MRTIIACMAALVVVVIDCGVPAQAQGSWPGGSWQGSCRSARVDGQTFSADCQTISGSYRRSSINVNQCPGRSVGNNNGQLVCENGGGYNGRLPGGSWLGSCTGGRMQRNTVYANCNAAGGGTRATSFDMGNCPQGTLGNRNGTLFCEGSGSSVMPGGSWQSSCRNAQWRDPMLSAMCNDGSGRFRGTSINVNQCPRRRVGNRNGSLFCEG
jgi:hypothetical protein